MSNEPLSMKVGFIGAGNMALALAQGFVNRGLIKANYMYASSPSGAPKFQVIEGCHMSTDNIKTAMSCEIIFLAVKPHLIISVYQSLLPAISSDKLLISVAAGITLGDFTTPSGASPMNHLRLVRCMPNTPCLVSCGVIGYIANNYCSTEDLDLVHRMFSSVALAVKVSVESHIDCISGTSGSSVAYMYMGIEAMADAAVKTGLPRKEAIQVAATAMMGAGKMVIESGKHPGQLKDEVCSPGGSTICGVHVLEEKGYRGALMSAVEEGVLKAKALRKTSPS